MLNLCLIRAALDLSIEEAANHILDVTPAAWEAWESARIIAPEWVMEKVSNLTYEQQAMLEAMRKVITEEGLRPISYSTYAAYLLDHPESSFISWRITQSVAKHFSENAEPHQMT